MNNDEKRIIRYFDGDLSPGEKEQFEQDLKTSAQLKKLFETYSNTFSLVAEARKISIPDDYIHYTPELKRNRNTINFPLKYAYGIFIIAMISGLLIFLNTNQSDRVLSYEESLIRDIESEHIRTYFETSVSSEEYYTELQEKAVNGNGYIDSLILSELNISQHNYNEMIDTYFSDLNASVFNDDDLEEIYSELSKKHFY